MSYLIYLMVVRLRGPSFTPQRKWTTKAKSFCLCLQPEVCSAFPSSLPHLEQPERQQLTCTLLRLSRFKFVHFPVLHFEKSAPIARAPRSAF